MEGPDSVAVRLQSLPAPDALEFDLPPGHVCLVSGDGTSLTTELVRRLVDRGWPVVLLHPGAPDAAVPEGPGYGPGLPGSVPTVALNAADETTVRAALASVAAHGPVGTVVILQPEVETGVRSWDIAPLRLPFLLAKHLQPALTAAAAHSAQARAGLITVMRLDGALGLTGRSSSGPVAAGVLGLTKSLRLEWPEVFCRAIDLDPAMAPDAGAEAIMAELFDPDRLTAEVGWGPQGRVTLTVAAGPPAAGGGV